MITPEEYTKLALTARSALGLVHTLGDCTSVENALDVLRMTAAEADTVAATARQAYERLTTLGESPCETGSGKSALQVSGTEVTRWVPPSSTGPSCPH